MMDKSPEHSQTAITGKSAHRSPLESDPRAIADYEVKQMADAILLIAHRMGDKKLRGFYLAQFKSILPAHHDLSAIVEECWRDGPGREAAE
jgi:hypothetical protein